MKIFNNIRNYIGEDKFRIVIYDDKIDIINFDSIIDINEDKVILNNLIIEGKNLRINKLLDNELLLVGKIGKVTFE